MYSEETKSSHLAKFFSIYDYVFVDTCSLMEDSFPLFMDTLEASKEYWKDGFEVIVLGECMQELKKHARNKENQEARIEAKRALKILRHDRWHGRTLTITKSHSNYGFADNAIYSNVSSLRIQKKVLIITQDKTLATDLRKLNSLDSQRGRYVEIYRLNANGELEENLGETYPSSRSTSGRPLASQPHSTPDKRPIFHRDASSPSVKTPVEAPIIKTSATASSVVPDLESRIKSQDEHLAADLSNPTYPKEKKLSSLDRQINDLNTLPSESRDRLSLAYTLDQLISEKVKLSVADGKPLVVAPVKEAAIAAKPAGAGTIVSSVVAEVKTEAKPLAAPAAVHRGWFEYGRSIQDALVKAGAHNNWVFRDATIPYNPIYGPYDITNLDLEAVALKAQDLKAGETRDLDLKTLKAHIEKTDRDYKVSVEEAAKASPLPETEKTFSAPKATPVPLAAEPAKTMPAPKGSQPRHPRSPRASVSAAPGATQVVPIASGVKPVASADGLAATPTGATLIVGIPTDKGKKAFMERRSHREDNPTVSIAQKNGKPATVKAQTTRAEPAKAVTPIAKAQVPHGEPAKVAPPIAKVTRPVTHSSEYDLTIKEDQDLNAKLNNPNYPKDSAIKDVAAQIERLRHLKPAEARNLHFPLRTLETKLKDLKAK